MRDVATAAALSLCALALSGCYTISSALFRGHYEGAGLGTKAIKVSSDPSGATVTIDGTVRGTTAPDGVLTTHVAARETHSLKVELAGHAAFQETISPELNGTIVLLDLIFGAGIGVLIDWLTGELYGPSTSDYHKIHFFQINFESGVPARNGPRSERATPPSPSASPSVVTPTVSEAAPPKPVEPPKATHAPPPPPARKPQVRLAPGLPRSTSEATIVVSVTASDESNVVDVTISNNNTGVSRRSESGRNLKFEVPVPLTLGVNRIEVVAKNDAGGTAYDSLRIERVEAALSRTLALLVSLGPRSEMSDLAAVLGATDEDVKMVKGNEATREGVLARLKELAARAGRADRLVVFVTGEGLVGKEPPDGSKPPRYFATHDASRAPSKLSTTALHVSEVGQVLGASKAGEVVVLLDASFAGDLGATRDELARNLVSRRGQCLLGVLHEPRGPSPSLAALVLKGLKGAADANKDGAVDTAELRDYIARNCDGCVALAGDQLDAPIKLVLPRK